MNRKVKYEELSRVHAVSRIQFAQWHSEIIRRAVDAFGITEPWQWVGTDETMGRLRGALMCSSGFESVRHIISGSLSKRPLNAWRFKLFLDIREHVTLMPFVSPESGLICSVILIQGNPVSKIYHL